MSKLISPWSDAESGAAWDRIRIGGVLFTGKVEVKGTPWKRRRDKRHSRGHNGARSVGAGYDLGEWTITLMSFDDETDAQLAAVVDAVTGGSPATQDAAALPIEHPALAVAGVNQVTFKEGDAPTPSGPGAMLVWEIKVEEYKAPIPTTPRVPAPAAQSPDARSRFGTEAESFAPRAPAPPTADP